MITKYYWYAWETPADPNAIGWANLTDYDTTRLVQSKEKAALRIRYQETGMHMCYFYNYKISQLTHST